MHGSYYVFPMSDGWSSIRGATVIGQQVDRLNGIQIRNEHLGTPKWAAQEVDVGRENCKPSLHRVFPKQDRLC